MKIRLKFMKQGQVKFVGHLDIMRLFQRAVKAAKIPIAYSQGFNPHSLVYFAMPLSVGTSSTGEYMDIVLSNELIPTEGIKPEKIMDMLNDVLVEGISITDAFYVEEDSTSLMSLVHAADYEIFISKKDFQGLSAEKINKKLDEPELIVQKKGKKGFKDINIKPMILTHAASETESEICLNVKILAGSSENLSPLILLKVVLGEEMLENKEIRINRKELYVNDQNTYKALDTYRRKE